MYRLTSARLSNITAHRTIWPPVLPLGLIIDPHTTCSVHRTSSACRAWDISSAYPSQSGTPLHVASVLGSSRMYTVHSACCSWFRTCAACGACHGLAPGKCCMQHWVPDWSRVGVTWSTDPRLVQSRCHVHWMECGGMSVDPVQPVDQPRVAHPAHVAR